MVQIKQKRGIGVENPSPRSFSGGIHRMMSVQLEDIPNSQLATRFAESCEYRAVFWELFVVPAQPAPQQAARVAGDVHMTPIQYIWSSELTFEALWYGVAMISRLLKIIGLFCKRAL